MSCITDQNKDEAARRSRTIDKELKRDAIDRETQKTVLLLGTGESGKTTILKQMKVLHINGYNYEDKMEKVPYIRHNIHESIYSIIANMEKLNPPIFIVNEKAINAAKVLLEIGDKTCDDYSQDFYDNVKLLWSDENVQKAFRRSNEYHLIDCAEHFLNQIDEIRKAEYVPTTQDILFCRIRTVTITDIEFRVQVAMINGGGWANFRMIDVGGQRGHRRQWIRVFEGIDSILFIISLSDFDQKLQEDDTTNRLKEAFVLFRAMFWSRYLRDAGMILFLNKEDMLKRKVESGRDIGEYFPTYYKFKKESKDLAELCEYEKVKLFVRHKIMKIVKDKPQAIQVGMLKEISHVEVPDRDIYIHYTTATDTENIKRIFKSVEKILIFKVLSNTIIL